MYAHTSLGVGTNYPKFLPIPTKEPENTSKSWKQMYPGSRYDKNPECPREVAEDNGGEWEGEFEEFMANVIYDDRVTTHDVKHLLDALSKGERVSTDWPEHPDDRHRGEVAGGARMPHR